jgi:hypothetical protein
MSRFNRSRVPCLFLLTLAACGPAPEGMTMKPGEVKPTTFAVRIENIAPFQQLKSGVYAVPVGKAGPGAIAPGEAFEFTFSAGQGHRLSFAMMLGASNDWVVAPEAKGIELYEAGAPISGDITSRLYLWDVGTEIDEEPGVGPHTGPNQSKSTDGPGAPDLNALVRRLQGKAPLANGQDFTLPSMASMIKATITPRGGREFRVRIENVSNDASTLMTSQGAKAVRFSPGVWALSNGSEPLFTDGQADRGLGLEAIAEMGAVDALASTLRPLTGAATGISPGVLVVHRGRAPLFTLGEKDRGMGLERIAEDGQADPLGNAMKSLTDASIVKVAVFDTPVGRENPSAVAPGRAYELKVSAVPGDRISFVTMFGWSNDWFFGTTEGGIELFDDLGQPLYGPVTGDVRLYDVGTELSEEAAVGANTGAQQAEPNTGALDTDNHVREVTAHEYALPVSHHLKVTLTKTTEAPSN